MNLRTLVLSSLIALGLTAAIIAIGSRISFGNSDLTKEAQGIFGAKVVQKLNSARAAQGLDDVRSDAELQSWLSERFPILFLGREDIDSQRLIDDLPSFVETVSTAAAKNDHRQR